MSTLGGCWQRGLALHCVIDAQRRVAIARREKAFVLACAAKPGCLGCGGDLWQPQGSREGASTRSCGQLTSHCALPTPASTSATWEDPFGRMISPWVTGDLQGREPHRKAGLSLLGRTQSGMNLTLKTHDLKDFPGGAVVGTPRSHRRGPGSIPGQGTRSHMHAATKSLHATTKDPACHN